MKQTTVMATCGMMAALSIVIMLIGGVLELGMYAAPMIAGICLLPIGDNFGKKPQIMTWLAVSLLSLMLVPNVEENLMYLGVFGLYPILYPYFQKLPKRVGIVAKYVYFNVAVILLEMAIMLFLVPEIMESIFLILLLLMGNVMFWCYDRLLPRMSVMMRRRFGKLFPRD